MLKRVSTVAALLLGSLPFGALGEIALGYQGGKQEAVSIGINRWDLAIGLDHFLVTADRRFTSRDFPALYFGVGGQVSDRESAPVGVRGKVGLSARAGFAELYGEVVPTLTLGNGTDFEFNYSVGLRAWF